LGSLTIDGPGVGSLDVRAGAGNHVFIVSGAPGVTISGMTISHAAVVGSSAGGIVVNSGAALTLDHAAVTGNSATITLASGSANVSGGGILSFGALTVRDSTVSNNSVAVTLTSAKAGDSVAAAGGGIEMAANAPLVIDSSTISGNTATASAPGAIAGAQGGGIQVGSASSNTAVIERTTISGNQATGQTVAEAGGMYTAAAGGSTLKSDTITANTVTSVTAIGANLVTSNATTENTIISNPHGALNCETALSDHSSGFNLEDGSSCGFNQATDQINVASTGLDPNLADNGGPTLTHALLSSSPAIDEGNSVGETTDQRGFPRPIDFAGIANGLGGDGSDIGAFEVQRACSSQSFPSQACHSLTVARAGTGSGTVTSSPSGIACGSICSLPFAASVTLTATPASGSTFAGWSGGGCQGTGTCQVTMSSDQTVTATFNATPVQHTLSVSVTGSGTVGDGTGAISCPPTCQHAYTAGSTVTLTATPASGAVFAGWSGACSGSATCTVTLSADRSAAASFTPAPPPVLSALRISPAKFALSGRLVKGRCIAVTRSNSRNRSCTRSIALRVSYRLTIPASVTFVLQRALDGRIVRGRCVTPTRANRRDHRCTRLTGLRGTITRTSGAGVGSFTFDGRIGGRRLGPGSYRLVATPSASARAGKSQSVTFQIVR
jgi:hypothetical protein